MPFAPPHVCEAFVPGPVDGICHRCRQREALHSNWATPRAPSDRSPAHCVRCDGPVEEARLCYAYPTCYGCLPPPSALPVLEWPPKCEEKG